jgi:transposase-like protein
VWHCKRLLRTDPLKALVIGGFVRGLSMRDVESLCEEAGLGRTSRSTVATICAELHERFEAFCRRSLYEVNLVVLFLDAIYLPVRPSGPKEGVICGWGITETGARELIGHPVVASTAVGRGPRLLARARAETRPAPPGGGEVPRSGNRT